MSGSDILLITRNLPPLVGGMERLVWHIADELRASRLVHVIGPVGCGRSLPPGVTATEIPLRPIPWFLIRCLLASLRQAWHQRPRVVMAGSGLVAPFAWLSARVCSARCVVYLHGLDIEAPDRIYRLFWHPFLRRFDRVLVNSRFTAGLAGKIGIAAQRVFILNPGVSVPTAADAASEREEFRRRHDLNDAPIMLYVGRITARKGLASFVERSLPSIVAEQPDARLVVIGKEPKHAILSATGERARIDEALTANGLDQSVLFLGELSDSELHAAYFAADVLVFPVQEHAHDIEGFGMVALEAAAHGLPTVAFAAGGVPDAVGNGVSGNLIAPGDHSAFARAVLTRLTDASRQPMENKKSITAFASAFSWPVFGKRLRELVWTGEADSP